jgi:hypothetical protein
MQTLFGSFLQLPLRVHKKKDYLAASEEELS